MECLEQYRNTIRYRFTLLKFLRNKTLNVALIDPKTIDFTHKLQDGITPNDKFETLKICNVLFTNECKIQLNEHHHNFEEVVKGFANHLKKYINIIFYEFNSLFRLKSSAVCMDCMNVLNPIVELEVLLEAI